MRATTLVIAIVVACSSIACASKAPVISEPQFASGDSERLQESLFKGDQAVLSNQEIERILAGQVSLTGRRRLAVLSLSPRNYWSQTVADADAENSERLLQALKGSPQLTQVRFMPSLLIPERRTIPYLREAAARFQSDLLFIYATRVQTFRQNRVLGSDEVRARCVGESVLLDIRTGIVIHTANATESLLVKRTSAELNFNETVAKAEADAIGKTLTSLATSASHYLAESQKQ